MKKLYNRSSLVMFAVSIFTISLIFFLVHPRVVAYLPGQSQRNLSSFIHTVQNQNRVDAQAYWYFREFYSLGSFTFEPEVVTVGESLKLSAVPHDQTTLFTFNSPRLKSTDYIVKRNPLLTEDKQISALLNDIVASNQPATSTLFKSNNTVIQQHQDQSYLLAFAKNIEEMRAANGFFNYSPSELAVLENTFWLNVTLIN